MSDIDVAETANGKLQIHLTATHGLITLSQTTGLTFSIGDGTSDTEMTFTGLPTDLNAALSGLQFTGPDVDFNTPYGGASTLFIETSDLGNTGSGGPIVHTNTISITITPVNDGPINTIPGAQTVAEGAILVFSAANSNEINVSDADVAETVNGTLQIELSASNGLLTLSQVTGLTFSPGDGTSDATMTITGLPTDLNTALSGMQFIGYPDNFNGEASLTIRTSDLAHTGSGGTKTDQDVIPITVTAVNDAPTLTTVSTLGGGSEDTEFTVSYETLSAAADESDVDGDALSFRIEAVSSGTLTMGGSAVVPGTTLIGSGENLVWTPALNAIGVLDAFTVKAWDGFYLLILQCR